MLVKVKLLKPLGSPQAAGYVVGETYEVDHQIAAAWAESGHAQLIGTARESRLRTTAAKPKTKDGRRRR